MTGHCHDFIYCSQIVRQMARNAQLHQRMQVYFIHQIGSGQEGQTRLDYCIQLLMEEKAGHIALNTIVDGGIENKSCVMQNFQTKEGRISITNLDFDTSPQTKFVVGYVTPFKAK